MFGLIRRISYSVIPRPDRPWEDDPTSNAPNTRRKRRLSSSERSASSSPENSPNKPSTPYSDIDSDPINRSSRERNDDGESARKRLRNDNMQVDDGDIALFASTENVANEDAVVTDGRVNPEQEKRDEATEAEVKNVTEGVKEVELEDKGKQGDQQVGDAGTLNDQDVEKASDVKAGSEQEVREAREGEVGDKDAKTANPASIPLPEGKEGELDEEQDDDGANSEENDATKVSQKKAVAETIDASSTDAEPAASSPSKKPALQSFRSPQKRPGSTKV